MGFLFKKFEKHPPKLKNMYTYYAGGEEEVCVVESDKRALIICKCRLVAYNIIFFLNLPDIEMIKNIYKLNIFDFTSQLKK